VTMHTTPRLVFLGVMAFAAGLVCGLAFLAVLGYVFGWGLP